MFKARDEKEKEYEDYWDNWHNTPLREKIQKLMNRGIAGSGRHLQSILFEIIDLIEKNGADINIKTLDTQRKFPPDES